MYWIRMDPSGLKWSELDWMRPKWTKWIELDHNQLKKNGDMANGVAQQECNCGDVGPNTYWALGLVQKGTVEWE